MRWRGFGRKKRLDDSPTMAATDGQIIMAASRFGDATPVYLREFCRGKLPAVVKVVKGQHQNLGVPTLSVPSLQSSALFLSAGKKYEILAQPIKIKEGRKPTNVGPIVLIPETFSGYFELLSEDGRSTRCIDSVLELSKRRSSRVLVRETFRCAQMNRTIHAGELLTTINDNGKILQCKNIKEEIIHLPLDTKAKFSPIAKEDSISGVHTVRNLLLKRMPIVVRMVHGSAPKGLKQPFVPELRLMGCVEIDRLYALPLQKDNDLIPVPVNAKIKLQRVRNMDQLTNLIEYSRFLEKANRLLCDERDRLQIIDLKLTDKERKELKYGSRNKLPILIFPTSTEGLAGSKNLIDNGLLLRTTRAINNDAYAKQEAAETIIYSNEIAKEYNEIDHIYDYVRGLIPLSKGLTRIEPIAQSHLSTDSRKYCSIKQIDRKPIKFSHYSFTKYTDEQTVSNNNCSTHDFTQNECNQTNNYSTLESNNHSNCSITLNGHTTHAYSQNHILQLNAKKIVSDDGKPTPPPIETIPGKKSSEKRQRPTLPKLYLKNVQQMSSTEPNSNSQIKNCLQDCHEYIHPYNSHSGATTAPAGPVTDSYQQVHYHHYANSAKIMAPANQVIYPEKPPVIASALNKDFITEPQSPLFHIRYKSLTSLQLTPDCAMISPSSKGLRKSKPPDFTNNCINDNTKGDAELAQCTSFNNASTAIANGTGSGPLVSAINGLHHCNHCEGTLDSSRSGGRTSGDSNKLPEKKSRRLSRPLSLSNLVWDLKPSKDKSQNKFYIHHLEKCQKATLYL